MTTEELKNSDIVRNSDGFSITDTLYSFINNRDFGYGYQRYRETGVIDNSSYIWLALSAIGQEVGNTLYENVLNYIDNVSNIDLCKVEALDSNVKMLGYNYTIFNSIKTFPLNIHNIIDVMSINRKYLKQTKVFGETLSSAISSYFTGVIDDENYKSFITDLYYNDLCANINLTYNGEKDPIWYVERDEIVFNKEDDSVAKEYKQFKRIHCIKESFDPITIVEKIINYEDFKDNYSGYELQLIEMELNRRSEKRPNTSELKTRYSYYRKETVKEYITFTEQIFNSLSDINNVNQNVYSLNGNYLELNTNDNYIKLIDSEALSVNTDMIHQVANQLAEMTMYISKLRDVIKYAVQRNYTKGTFNLISFVINEYLIELSKTNVFNDETLAEIKSKLSKHTFNDIELIEYYDNTEYFNIQTSTTPLAKNNVKVNPRYWENKTSTVGLAFDDAEISSFYQEKMNPDNKIKDFDRFLNTLFSLGANKSYINKMTDENVVIGVNENDENENKTIFLSYNGNKVGYNPYCNAKNVTHPSFQLHPYLFNFIKYNKYELAIKDGFIGNATSELEDQYILENIDEYIGNFGEVVNVAAHNQADFSGYKSGYEKYAHTELNEVQGYDGIFFPPAINDFNKDTEKFIDDVRNMKDKQLGGETYYEKYYKHLNLSRKECEIIADKLECYKELLKDVSSTRLLITSKHYDIYKYGKDKFNNAYILLKVYNSIPQSVSYKTKQNTPGQLWIRLNNHPIAFPAFYGEKPQITTDDKFNIDIKYLALLDSENKHNMVLDRNQMAYFYDMEFDSYLNSILLATYPVNDYTDESKGVVGRHNKSITNSYYKDIQHADVIASNITYEYNVEEKIYQLRLVADTIAESYVLHPGTFDSQDIGNIKTITAFSYVGMYNTGDNITILYVQKQMKKGNYGNVTYSIPNNNLVLASRVWKYNSKREDANGVVVNITEKINPNYKITNGNIDITFNNGVFQATFLTKPENVTIQNYWGIHNSNGKADYNEQTKIFKDQYNSFNRLESFITTVTFTLIESSVNLLTGNLFNLHTDPSFYSSLPNNEGRIDIEDVKTTSPEKYNQFQILGNAQAIDIDQTLNFKPDIKNYMDLDYIKKNFKDGRVYENYDDTKDKSIQIFKYSQIKDGYTKGSLHWEINISAYGLNEKDFEDTYILMLNTDNYGKNPYFLGHIREISATSYSTKDHGTYMLSSESNEIIRSNDNYIGVTGTFNSFNKTSNRTDNNHLYNIDDIILKFENGIITVDFQCENNDINYYIKDKAINLMVIAEGNLECYEFYHLLNEYGLSTEYNPDISATNLSDYNYLSDIPFLSGYFGHQFKYDEGDVYTPNSPRFYFPGCNDKYPLNNAQVIKADLLPSEYFYSQDFHKIFKENSLFVLKYDYNSLLSTIGSFEIPLTTEEDVQYITGLDEYTVHINDYDIVNPLIAQYIDFDNENKIYNKHYYDIKTGETLEEFTKRIYEKDGLIIEGDVFDEESKEMLIKNVSNPTLSEFEGFGDLLNIYINYKKEEDNTFTLYFNYINKINSPFINFDKGHPEIEIFEDSYLKLDQGNNKEGILAIYAQFKYYSDLVGTLAGIKNVRLASYKIINISDDKPKFILRKISDKPIIVNNKTSDTTYINMQVSNLDIEVDDTTSTDKLKFDIVVSGHSDNKISKLDYYLVYPSNNISCTDQHENTGNIHVNEDITTSYSYSKTFKFETLLPKKDLREQFNIIYIDPVDARDIRGNELDFSITDGSVNIRNEIYLRKESEVKEDLVLQETEEAIKI